MRADAWDVVSEIYRLRGQSDAWMRGLLDTLRPLIDAGLGVGGYYFDARRAPELTVTDLICVGMMDREVAAIARILEAMRAPNERSRRVLALVDGCGTASEIMSPRLFSTMPHLAALSRVSAIRDFLGIVATDPGGMGCVINAPLAAQGRISPALRRPLGRVAAHIAAALRLRRATDALSDAADLAQVEAIFLPSGRPQHLTGGTTHGHQRAQLIDAVRRREHGRARLRRLDPADALAEWVALVGGRWTLLDEIESDGKRFIVARRNPAPAPPLAQLTPGQAQVVGFALLGHSNKLIAYELGLTESGVAMRLRRAGERLGAPSRLALVRTVRRLLERGP